MRKIIAIIRTSTDAQEVESQRKEVLEMIAGDGYREEEVEVIGDSGASAIKLDDQYLENMEKVYRRIEAGGVEAVYAWAIDRIGRNEEVLMKLKNTLISNRIQLVIKNPSMKLLNEDGSVNAGMELAFSLFATMAKQEMEQKKARFTRARERNISQGRSIGGSVALGYELDKNKFWVVNEEEKELVRLIFSLFNTGKYSTTALAKELNERGKKTKKGADFTPVMVGNILKNTTYTGEKVDKRGRKRVTPAIVSMEEQEKAKKLLKENNSRQGKSSKRYPFGLKLIRCKECERNYQVYNGTYHCTGNILSKREGSKHLSDCSCTTSLAVSNLDGILWKLTTGFLMEEIERGDTELIQETKASRDVLKGKITVLRDKLTQYTKKIDEIVTKADQELRSEEYISRRISNVRKLKEADEKELVREEEELNRLEAILRGSSSFHQKYLSGYMSIGDIELKGDEKTMRDLVHRYISKVTFEKTTYRENKNYYRIEIETYKGVYIVFYNGRDRYLGRCYMIDPGDKFQLENPFFFERVRREGGSVKIESTERYRTLRRIVEGMEEAGKSYPEIKRELEETHKTVLEACRRDNNPRVVVYLNEVEKRLEKL